MSEAKLINYSVSSESIVLVEGNLTKPDVPIASCTIHDMELNITKVKTTASTGQSYPLAFCHQRSRGETAFFYRECL